MSDSQPTQVSEQQTAGWMITFADLLSLLLTFFVLLFSMSTVQFDSWKAVVAAMTDEFNEDRPQIDLTPQDSSSVLAPSTGPGLNLNYLRVLLERSISGHANFEGVSVVRQGDRVIVSIPADLMFERKDSTLVTGSVRPLRQLAGTLAQIKNRILITGHTDAVPVSSGKYRSNWELSMARARIVAGILTDFGYRQAITVLGYADTANGRAVSARDFAAEERVEIVIVPERHEGGLYDLF